MDLRLYMYSVAAVLGLCAVGMLVEWLRYKLSRRSKGIGFALRAKGWHVAYTDTFLIAWKRDKEAMVLSIGTMSGDLTDEFCAEKIKSSMVYDLIAPRLTWYKR